MTVACAHWHPLSGRPHSIYKISKMESEFTAANRSWDRSDDKLLWCLAAMNQESAGGRFDFRAPRCTLLNTFQIPCFPAVDTCHSQITAWEKSKEASQWRIL